MFQSLLPKEHHKLGIRASIVLLGSLVLIWFTVLLVTSRIALLLSEESFWPLVFVGLLSPALGVVITYRYHKWYQSLVGSLLIYPTGGMLVPVISRIPGWESTFQVMVTAVTVFFFLWVVWSLRPITMKKPWMYGMIVILAWFANMVVSDYLMQPVFGMPAAGFGPGNFAAVVLISHFFLGRFKRAIAQARTGDNLVDASNIIGVALTGVLAKRLFKVGADEPVEYDTLWVTIRCAPGNQYLSIIQNGVVVETSFAQDQVWPEDNGPRAREYLARLTLHGWRIGALRSDGSCAVHILELRKEKTW